MLSGLGKGVYPPISIFIKLPLLSCLYLLTLVFPNPSVDAGPPPYKSK